MYKFLIVFFSVAFFTSTSCKKEIEIIKETIKDTVRLKDTIRIKDTINFADTTALKKGLVAWYPFRGSLNDVSGNNLNGAFAGNAKLTLDERGLANNAVEFDGFGDAVVVGPSSKFNMNDSVTIAFKFISTIDIQRQNFIGFENYYAGNSTVFQIGKSTPASPLITGGIAIPGTYVCGNMPVASDVLGFATSFNPEENIWYHLAVTYTKTSLRVYINGVQISEVSTNNKPFPYCANANLIIGSWWNFGSGGFSLNGKMDDVRIYSRLLSEKEIGDLFKVSLYVAKIVG
jgi:Concanavalin A-like lectin/glucanases superfamily